MNITNIDATSYATRVAQQATAELFGLLSSATDALEPVQRWFDPDFATLIPDRDRSDDDVETALVIEALGEYACARSVAGETLYRWAIGQEFVARGEWTTLAFATQLAFTLFCQTAENTVKHLTDEQQRLAAAKARPTAPAPLKLEDSIFEEHDKLSELRPEAVQQVYHQRLVARTEQDAKEKAKEETKAASAAKKAEKAAEGPVDAKGAAPLSVGEAPATIPINRGGRPRQGAPRASPKSSPKTVGASK